MTPQEAINNIDDVLSSDVNFDESIDYQLTSWDIDWLEVAKEALKKQISIKPDLEGDGYDENGYLIYDTGFCPNCNHEFEVDYDATKCCPDCGQALDWSDTE